MNKKLKMLCCSFLLSSSLFMVGCDDHETSSKLESNTTFIEKEKIEITIDETYNLYVMLKEGITGSVTFSIQDETIAQMQSTNVMIGKAIGNTHIIIRQDDLVQVLPLIVYDKNDSEHIAFFTLDKGRLYQKKVVFYGDSISQWETIQAEWILKLANYYQLSHINYAIAGTTLAYTPVRFAYYGHWGTELMYTHEKDNQNADYIFVLYGTNDIDENVPVGETDFEMLNNYNDETPTYRGAVNYAIHLLREQNPNVRIVWLSLIYRDTNLTKAKEYNDALYRLCLANMIKYIDLFSLWDANTKGPNMNDSLHPSSAGQQLMFEKIIQS